MGEMDHDRLFKELLTNFFVEFIELFFPRLAMEIDRDSIQFLDKEIFTDVSTGERHEVDLLVKVRLRDGEAFILIHVENQAHPQPGFPRRMFQYYARLDGKFGLPIYPIAIFSYDRPFAPAADRFEVNLFDLQILRFHFATIQLNRLNWRDFLNKPNPVASALMTKMNFTPEERPRVKLECLRMLATLKLNPARTTLIGVFMNSYLELTEAEMAVYNRELETFEPEQKEFVMEIVNEWTKSGSLQGRVKMLVRMLQLQFGELPTNLVNQIRSLGDAQIDDLGDAVLGFKTLADAEAWLARS
jgi:hypothetical protein